MPCSSLLVSCQQSVNMERTFIAVKPDGVQRGLCGDIIKRFEQRGFRLVAAKFMQVTMATDQRCRVDILFDLMYGGQLGPYVTFGFSHSSKLHRSTEDI